MRSLLVVVVLSSLGASASADVILAAGAGIGGGVGSAPRPVYGAHAGIEASVVFHDSWGVGASFDRIVLERPDGNDVDDEYQADLFLLWQLVHDRRTGWFSLGAGWRRLRIAAPDPELGDVTLHGINVLHARAGGDWRIGARTRLGIAFEWTVGWYRSGEYDADAAAAYANRYDQAPPELNAKLLGSGGNIYAIGPRLSVVLD
jgi:hypothetical protein